MTTNPSDITIPFNRSSLVGRELEYIFRAMAIGQIAGDQSFSQRCHAFLEAQLNVKRALLTTSCTHALEMSALLLRIQPGDEVIVPSFTFVTTANAFVLRGARPVFCDIRSDTLNLDESRLSALVTPRTRVIVPVHYAGVACEMDAILAIAADNGIQVVEDNAHGLFGTYRGKLLGTFGALATQSFHETKNFTCGEGGALLINDPALIERAEIVREKGTNRAKFFRGQVDKYTWVDLGSSYLMSDVLAAFLLAQLEQWQQIQVQRRHLWMTYHARLSDWCRTTGARQPIVPEHCGQSYHMYYLLAPTEAFRAGLIAHLRTAGILGVFHYVPLHLSPMGASFGARAGDCPVAEFASDRLLRLPLFFALSAPEQDRVIETITSFGV